MEEHVFNQCRQSRLYASALKAGMELNVKYQPLQLPLLLQLLPLQKVIKSGLEKEKTTMTLYF